MNEVDNIYEIIERIQRTCIKAEEAGATILRILDQMEQFEQLMEKGTNVGS